MLNGLTPEDEARRSLDSQSLLRPASDAATMERWLQVDQAILDALPIGFCCCDSEGRIVTVNRRANELWGRPVSLMDPEQRFCGSFHLEDLAGRRIPKEESPMARAARYGESFEGLEAVVQNPDGKRWVVRVRVAPLRDRFGHLVGAVNCFADVTAEYELRLAHERQQRTFDLAMVASQMGTWRYTLADNVCVYDANAQRLYGLTESRFLHDEQGVREKFHRDDIELMWSSVRSALDPEGTGRYEIEYRVKQLDGHWRWLSAWGVVEFEGQGADRKPIAISGASRDLSDTKKAEELERLLVNELNHRVKNTIATVQAIVAHTLRHSNDLPSAREALYPRLASLARVHDLLTRRNWTGSDVREVVQRAMEPFAATQLDVSGPSVELAPHRTLALSLALHELATNAAKYGALSTADGRVDVQWTVANGYLKFQWRESRGPRVEPPVHRGFGTRLLEDSLSTEFEGGTKLDYMPEGVRCEFTLAF